MLTVISSMVYKFIIPSALIILALGLGYSLQAQSKLAKENKKLTETMVQHEVAFKVIQEYLNGVTQGDFNKYLEQLTAVKK